MGFTGPNGGPCAACVAGKFKIDSGSGACIDCGSGKYSTTVGATSDVCQACPTNSDAPQASNEQTDCTCDAGFTGSDGGACTACEGGKYKSQSGNAPCSICPAGKYKAMAGANTFCDNCEAGTWKASAGINLACDHCTAGKYQAASGVNTFCEDCEAGKYGDRDRLTGCTECPSSATSPTGSTSQDQCVKKRCGTGMWGPDGGPCTPCPSGTYKDVIAPDTTQIACMGCVPGKYSAEGSDACTRCPEGTYSTVSLATSSVVCSPCPDNANSPAGSAECRCNAGYSGPSGGACSPTPSSEKEINMVVVLPYTVEEFLDEEVQNKFKSGVSLSVGVDATDVRINKVSAASRRSIYPHRKLLQASGIDVDFSVVVTAGRNADTMISQLTIENLNSNLKAQGVREVTAVKTAPTVLGKSDRAAAEETAQ